VAWRLTDGLGPCLCSTVQGAAPSDRQVLLWNLGGWTFGAALACIFLIGDMLGPYKVGTEGGHTLTHRGQAKRGGQTKAAQGLSYITCTVTDAG
jgi:hypothetical protein